MTHQFQEQIGACDKVLLFVIMLIKKKGQALQQLQPVKCNSVFNATSTLDWLQGWLNLKRVG
jgi:hypothetical protein